MKLRMPIFLLVMIVSTHAALAQEEGSQTEETPSELVADSREFIKTNLSPFALQSPENPIFLDMELYAAYDGGMFHGAGASLGTSIRVQKGANGAELEVSVLGFDALDIDAGLGYKAALSYLYHFQGKRSGLYVGVGPGFVANQHIFDPLAVTWVGYQFASYFPKERRFSGFVDGGFTITFPGRPDRERVIAGISEQGEIVVARFIPTVRTGLGLSF